jgi:hypothetical protein
VGACAATAVLRARRACGRSGCCGTRGGFWRARRPAGREPSAGRCHGAPAAPHPPRPRRRHRGAAPAGRRPGPDRAALRRPGAVRSAPDAWRTGIDLSATSCPTCWPTCTRWPAPSPAPPTPLPARPGTPPPLPSAEQRGETRDRLSEPPRTHFPRNGPAAPGEQAVRPLSSSPARSSARSPSPFPRSTVWRAVPSTRPCCLWPSPVRCCPPNEAFPSTSVWASWGPRMSSNGPWPSAAVSGMPSCGAVAASSAALHAVIPPLRRGGLCGRLRTPRKRPVALSAPADAGGRRARVAWCVRPRAAGRRAAAARQCAGHGRRSGFPWLTWADREQPCAPLMGLCRLPLTAASSSRQLGVHRGGRPCPMNRPRGTVRRCSYGSARSSWPSLCRTSPPGRSGPPARHPTRHAQGALFTK